MPIPSHETPIGHLNNARQILAEVIWRLSEDLLGPKTDAPYIDFQLEIRNLRRVEEMLVALVGPLTDAVARSPSPPNQYAVLMLSPDRIEMITPHETEAYHRAKAVALAGREAFIYGVVATVTPSFTITKPLPGGGEKRIDE